MWIPQGTPLPLELIGPGMDNPLDILETVSFYYFLLFKFYF